MLLTLTEQQKRNWELVNGGLCEKKQARIPDDEIQMLQETLNLSEKEAIFQWLQDEGYELEETQQELTKTAEKNKITQTIHKAREDKPKKKTQKERTQKIDPDKEKLVKAVFTLLNEMNCKNVEIANKNKLVVFEFNGSHYEWDLRKKREKKG